MAKKSLVKKSCVVNTLIGVTILWFLLGSVLIHNLISKNHDAHEIKHRIHQNHSMQQKHLKTPKEKQVEHSQVRLEKQQLNEQKHDKFQNLAFDKTAYKPLEYKLDERTLEQKEKDYNTLLDELDEISGGANAKNLTCPPPLVPFQNIIRRNNFDPKDRIPKILHFTMPSRCIPQDIYRTLDRWHHVLKRYSIFFHDDAAVEKLLSQEWTDFPLLHDALICVMYKGAMRIDIWRILLMYKYGGIYSDIDNWPRPKMKPEEVRTDLSAWFLTDYNDHPSQWFIAIEKNHPIMYLTIHKIIDNLLWLPSLWRIQTVKVTGPFALWNAYFHFLNGKGLTRAEAAKKMIEFGNPTDEMNEKYKDNKVWVGMEDKEVIKMWNGRIDYRQYVGNKIGYEDIVPHPFNSTMNITRGDRIDLESGIIHWRKVSYHSKFDMKEKGIKIKLTCRQYIENIKSGEMKPVELI